MSATTVHVCDGRPDPGISRQRRAEIAERRRRVRPALEAGPGTAAEIRDRMGEHTWRGAVYWGRDCRGHLDERVYVTRFCHADVQRELIRLEKLGLAGRVVVQGVQAHLWYPLAAQPEAGER